MERWDNVIWILFYRIESELKNVYTIFYAGSLVVTVTLCHVHSHKIPVTELKEFWTFFFLK